MRKLHLLLVFGLILLLSSCTLSETDLSIKLNPGIDTIEIGETYIDTGASAQYGYRQLTPSVITNNVDSSNIGVYEIIYQIKYLDYEKSITRYVTVLDQVPPLLSLNPGIDTIIVGNIWIDTSIQALDDSEDPIEIVVEGFVDTHNIGEYLITYFATDSSGNTSHISRYVSVINPTS